MQDVTLNGVSSEETPTQNVVDPSEFSEVTETEGPVARGSTMETGEAEAAGAEAQDLLMEDAESYNKTEEIAESPDLTRTNYSINDLPIEVLQYVFSWCVVGPDPVGVVRERNAITSVCRHWREAIRNIPEVWKLVPFKGPGNFDASFACIERAKALPLTIFIDQRDPNWNGDEDNFTFGPNAMMDLLDKITEFRDRVEELHIVVNTWFVMQSALSWLQAQPPLPLLKRLELRRAGPQYVIIEGNPPAGLSVPGLALFQGQVSPRLKHINLSGVHVHWENTVLMGLESLSLRRLAVELGPSLRAFRDILQRSPCLRNLLLLDASPIMRVIREDAEEEFPPIKLNHLTDVSVGKLNVEHAIYVFSQFTATNLRRLTLSALNFDDYAPLLLSITGSFPSLTVLFIESFETEDQAAIYGFLQSLMNLRYLKVGDVAKEFFQALCSYIPLTTASGTGDASEEQWIPICPLLETVEFTNVEFQVLYWFHEYRRDMGAPLKQIFISYRLLPRLNQPAFDWLRGLGQDVVRLVPYGSIPYNDPKYLT